MELCGRHRECRLELSGNLTDRPHDSLTGWQQHFCGQPLRRRDQVYGNAPGSVASRRRTLRPEALASPRIATVSEQYTLTRNGLAYFWYWHKADMGRCPLYCRCGGKADIVWLFFTRRRKAPMRVKIAIAASAMLLAAANCRAEDNKSCISKATQTLPRIVGLVIKKTRTRNVPPGILATWQGQTRPGGEVKTYGFLITGSHIPRKGKSGATSLHTSRVSISSKPPSVEDRPLPVMGVNSPFADSARRDLILNILYEPVVFSRRCEAVNFVPIGHYHYPFSSLRGAERRSNP
jgi:hypothetical protein